MESSSSQGTIYYSLNQILIQVASIRKAVWALAMVVLWPVLGAILVAGVLVLE